MDNNNQWQHTKALKGHVDFQKHIAIKGKLLYRSVLSVPSD